MSQVTVAGVVAGTVDGAGSIVKHLEDLKNNPNDSVAQAQVTADFQNLSAAVTALVPGVGGSAAFVALSADLNLVLQKVKNGSEISRGDIIPIAGNLITLVGQVVEAAGLAATPVTGGASLPLGITAGEALDALGGGIAFYGLGTDMDDVRAGLGMLASTIQSMAGSSPATNIPQVIVTADRVTSTSSSWSADGKTLIENLSDQSTRYTTVSPDGTTVTKVYKEADGQISSQEVQIYSNSSRTTLVSSVESTPDPTTNTTTITTTNYNSGTPTFNTEVINSATPNSGTVTGSATGTLNQDGSISNATISGNGISINTNDASITVNSGAQANSSGMDNSVSAGSSSVVSLANNSSATINGSNVNVSAAGGDTLAVNGSSDVVNGATGDNITVGGNGSTGQSNFVYANGATVNVENSSRSDIFGSGDTVNAGASDNYGVWGTNNTIDSQSSSNVWIGNYGASGAADQVNANGCIVTVGDFFRASIAGASTVATGGYDDLATYSDNTHVTISGQDTTLNNYGTGVVTSADGSNDVTNNHGYDDVTYNYGSGDATYDYGSDEYNYNYGSDEYGWAASSSDYNYDANSSDTGGGYTYDPGPGYGYYGYYGYYGLAGKPAANDATKGSNIGSIAQFDKAHGKLAAAAVAQKAHAEIGNAIMHNSKVALSGAKWENDTVTWSVGSGGDFSGSMSPSEVQAAKQAFADWSKATGLNFVEVASTDTADITIGMGSFDTSNTGVVGFTTFRAKAGHIQPGAIVRVEDVSEDPLVSGADGTYVYGGTDATFSQVLLHEIGHTLGFGDNADPTSVESYYLNAANRTLSSNDIAQAAALYGSRSVAGNVVHQLIHAMSSFAPAPMVSSTAANDPGLSAHPMLYSGNHFLQRAN